MRLATGAFTTLLLMAVPVWAWPMQGPRHDAVDSNGFTHSFRSAPSLHPPIVSTSGTDPDPASGDIFLEALNSIQAGPVILSPNGRLIWFDPLSHRQFATDVKVQRYQGQTVLTYWQGYSHDDFVLLNHRYQTVAVVRVNKGYIGDNHEFTITPQGTALISVYRDIPANLSSVGGPRHGTLLDSGIQDGDIATGRVLWQWDAYSHISLKDSHAGKPGAGPYDAYHLNSIQQLPSGNLLVSSRHTWAVYEISKRTGKIIWQLGGKHSSFKIGPGASFKWQHDARLQPDGSLTLLDNNAGTVGPQGSGGQSRALRLRLNMKTRQATLIRAYVNNPPLLSSSQGNVQVLPDGNVFVGWGGNPKFTEFSPTGTQLFSGGFSGPLQIYRAFRFRWWGQPTSPPGIAVRASPRGTTVYASWNGATGVRAWRVLAGSGPSAMKTVGRFADSGFETVMSVSTTQSYFSVQPLGSSGAALSTSATVRR